MQVLLLVLMTSCSDCAVVLQALRSLVTNEAVQLEPYLHQIMPFILTCMVGKRLGVSLPPQPGDFTSDARMFELHIDTYCYQNYS